MKKMISLALFLCVLESTTQAMQPEKTKDTKKPLEASSKKYDAKDYVVIKNHKNIPKERALNRSQERKKKYQAEEETQ